MEPNKNKSPIEGGYFIPNNDWEALADVLDQIASDTIKGSAAGSPRRILALRLRGVADFARDPFNEAKIK